MKERERGFINILIMILIAIVAFSYFGIDLEQAVKQPLLVKNLSFTWRVIEKVWTDYVYHPLSIFFPKTKTGPEN